MLLIGTCFIVAQDRVFAEQEGDYTYTVSNGVATITGYTGAGGAITIPSTLGGYPTEYIGDYAFYFCSSLTSVVIPDSVTTIGYSAFCECHSLTSVVIPDSVTTIDNLVFSSCYSLTSVVIGNSVTTNGLYAFGGCQSLTSITFLGLVAPTSVDWYWIKNTPAEIRGHAYADSNFPPPGETWNGLTMGAYTEPPNHPPVANANGPYSGDEGSLITFDASASTDPDDDTLQYRWDFENDGTWNTDYSTDPTATHTWDDDYSGTVVVEVYDGEETDTATSTVTVNNVAPTISSLDLPLYPIQIGDTVDLTANFTDNGVSDAHTATVDWGDGNTSAGSITGSAGSYTATTSWTYGQAGVYTVTLTVEDDDGGSAMKTFQYVVVYNPTYGFVTGAGLITSIAGAYTPDPTLTGMASFGFVSRYTLGQQTPTGSTGFKFRVADMNFQSNNYQWLVIAGAKAMYKGTGTINGQGNYGFMLSAIDEDITPSTDVDLFRIKIWDKDNNDEVIYDNQLGEDDDTDPTTGIQGGNIKVHKF